MGWYSHGVSKVSVRDTAGVKQVEQWLNVWQSSWENCVADDFGYVCLDKGKRELVNVIDGSKHNAEKSHTQHPKQ